MQQVLTLSSRGGGGPFERRSDLNKKRSDEAGAPVLAALVPAFLAITAASFLGKTLQNCNVHIAKYQTTIQCTEQRVVQ